MLGAAVLVVAIIALRNPKGTVTNAGSITATSSSRSTSGPAPSSSGASSNSTSPSPSHRSLIGSEPLIVLNNTSMPNLARDAAQRFERAGWHVTSYASYSNDILNTAAYYDPNVPGAKAAALALQRQFPTIKRVVVRFPQLPPGPIVVVLDPDYSTG